VQALVRPAQPSVVDAALALEAIGERHLNPPCLETAYVAGPSGGLSAQAPRLAR
jgi:hypothetical protein